MMAVLQSISIISPLSPITAILPLVFVVAVSMLREGVEDYMRYIADKGNQPLLICYAFRNQQLEDHGLAARGL